MSVPELTQTFSPHREYWEALPIRKVKEQNLHTLQFVIKGLKGEVTTYRTNVRKENYYIKKIDDLFGCMSLTNHNPDHNHNVFW